MNIRQFLFVILLFFSSYKSEASKLTKVPLNTQLKDLYIDSTFYKGLWLVTAKGFDYSYAYRGYTELGGAREGLFQLSKKCTFHTKKYFTLQGNILGAAVFIIDDFNFINSSIPGNFKMKFDRVSPLFSTAKHAEIRCKNFDEDSTVEDFEAAVGGHFQLFKFE